MSELHQQDATSTSFNEGGTGESSNDECCLCGKEWTPDEKGWPLCDTADCPNTVCSNCAQIHQLSVSELFYCPPCAGGGQSAAATVGGAVATAVAALSSALERLPMSQATLRTILRNIQEHPTDPKFRRLRLENKSIKEYIDLEPVRRILESIGFFQTEETRQKPKAGFPSTEQVLVLDGDVDVALVKELADVMDGLSSEDVDIVGEEISKIDTAAVAAPAKNPTAEPTQGEQKVDEQSASTTKTTRKGDNEEGKSPSKKAKHS